MLSEMCCHEIPRGMGIVICEGESIEERKKEYIWDKDKNII